MIEWAVMMQLPLTSLVPTIVEITSFVEQNWPHIWWFPNWYLGVPLRFISGPVVPTLIILLRRLTSWPVEQAYLVLIGGIWVIGGIGVAQLTKALGGEKRAQWWVAVLFLLLPFHLLLLSYGNGLHHVVVAIFPWVFWIWMRALKESGRIKEIWGIGAAGLAAVVLLVDVSGLLLILIGGMTLNFLGNRGDWGKRGIKSLLILMMAFSLATIWYTPRFWWTLLGNPSFGGKPLSNVIPFILQLVQALIPLILGVWVVQKRYRLTNKMIQFGLLFGSSFLFLTLIRMLSDIDFWMDWTGYFLEMQLALALLVPVGILRLSASVRSNRLKRLITLFIISILTISDGAVMVKLFGGDMKDKTYKANVTKITSEQLAPGEPFDTSQDKRIFLSGSPVFWLSSSMAQDLPLASPNNHPQKGNPIIGASRLVSPAPGFFQLRGGRDEASTHPTWAMGAYQIREGTDPLLLKDWLTVLGISYVLVHKEGSQEYFHDFKNTTRFAELIEEEEFAGNILYQTPGAIARLANREILTEAKPEGGDDKIALPAYSSHLGQSLSVRFPTPTLVELSLDQPVKKDEVVSIALTYDPAWRLVEGEGRLLADPFGNMVIEPTGESQLFLLRYQEDMGNWLPGVFASLLFGLILIKTERVTRFLLNHFSPLSSTFVDEEAEY